MEILETELYQYLVCFFILFSGIFALINEYDVSVLPSHNKVRSFVEHTAFFTSIFILYTLYQSFVLYSFSGVLAYTITGLVIIKVNPVKLLLGVLGQTLSLIAIWPLMYFTIQTLP